MINSSRLVLFDKAAIGLSSLCLLHCLALPVLATISSVAASLADLEWLHRAFVLMAVPLTLTVASKVQRNRNGAIFIGLATIGLVCLLAGAFVEQLHDFETPLTFVGAVSLSLAHILHWRWHSSALKR